MAQYPTAAGTDANLWLVANNKSTSLSDNPLTIGATTVNVASTTGFPTTGYITIDSEAIKYTSTTGTSFTGCTRGADGTTAASHVTATQVFHDVVADHHNVLKDEIKAIETDLVASYTGGSTSIATTFAKYLKLIGGSMTGAIAMGANKITGLANGTAATDAAAFGQLHLMQAPVSAVSTTPTTTTSSTYQVTNTSASITPTSASSKILVLVSGAFENDVSGANAFATIARGGTNQLAAAGGTMSRGPGVTISGGAMVFLDSPATTSATTYAVYIKNGDNTSSIAWGSSSGTTSIVLLEVQ